MFYFNLPNGEFLKVSNNREVFNLLKSHAYKQVDTLEFNIIGDIKPPKSTYKNNKNALEEIAIIYSYRNSEFNSSYGELLVIESFFRELGAQYGLLTEFRENAIC